MNVFKRLRDIISSNVNALLDRMEDPEKLIDLSITELEDASKELRKTIAEKNAELKTIVDLREENKAALERWSERARLAANKNQDDMAREAINEKLKLSEIVKNQEETIITLKSLIKSLEESKKEADEKLIELREKSFILKSRARSAKERKKAHELIEKSSSAKFDRRIAEIKAKVDKWEAEANIPLNNNQTFEELERNEAIEKELQALKKAANE